MFTPLEFLLRTVVQDAPLIVIDHKDRRHQFGHGDERAVVIRLRDAKLERELAFNPQLHLGEAYMDGRLVVVEGSIFDLLKSFLSGPYGVAYPQWLSSFERLRMPWQRLVENNSIIKARRNASYHYDLDAELYESFLDSDQQYSCAYFDETDRLDEAQLAKKRHITAKLALPDQPCRILDIGSGWGGLALYLAGLSNIDVTGITLSKEQLALSRDRAEAANVTDRVHFELCDFREVTGRYDRIVSIGMLEHVGVRHYGAFFRKIRDLLPDDGVCLIHCIGRSDTPTPTNAFIAKYIFPGGYIPALSDVMPAIEASGLITCDIEILRLHYAKTLRQWRDRLTANRAMICQRKGPKFFRMWEFYLAGSEAAFRFQNFIVFQIQLARNISTLSLTRHYIEQEEQRLREIEKSIFRGNAQANG